MNDEEQTALDPDPAYRYWAFISYSSKDAAWARWLQRSIESYGIPAKLADHDTPIGEPAPRHFRPCFRDREELAAGDLGAQIEEALEASRYLIVVCSPNAARSRWVDKEITSFQALGGTDRVLALVVEGEPNAGDERECFPPALKETEPLAADAREIGDGKRDALLKLLAGMLGVDFDALKQCDAHRRIRRLQIGIATALAMVVVFAGLTAFAWVQRNTANHEREEALTARHHAEGILSYLLGDLRGTLEPMGKLELIADVQARIDEYYRALGVEPSDPQTLHNRVVALLYEGSRLTDQQDPSGALLKYQAALAIARGLAASERDTATWQGDVALCEAAVGSILESENDMARALPYCRDALRTYQTLCNADPGDTALQSRLAQSHCAVGSALQDDDPSAAMQHYLEALRIAKALAQSDAQNDEWRRLLATADRHLGGLLQSTGDHRRAIRFLRDALTISWSLVEKDSNNAPARWQLSLDLLALGGVLEDQGDRIAALRAYRESTMNLQWLVRLDPENVPWREELSTLRAAVRRCST